MITPILEKLIFEGKAQYKTFVAGLSQKHIMNIPENRYIIITDLWYTPTLYFEVGQPLETEYIKYMITQLTILGTKGFNRFLFKNSININYNNDPLKNNNFSPNNPIHISTFLVHIDGISFTFSNQENFAITTALANFDNPALPNPTDYGKTGIPGSINTINAINTFSGFENNFHNQKLTTGQGGSNEFSFAVNGNTNLDANIKTTSISYPILNVGYVEIIGQPNNIGY